MEQKNNKYKIKNTIYLQQSNQIVQGYIDKAFNNTTQRLFYYSLIKIENNYLKTKNFEAKVSFSLNEFCDFFEIKNKNN